MKKTSLIKVVSILLISAMVFLFNGGVFAADGFNDLTSTLSNTNSNSSNSNTSSNNTNSNTANNSNRANTNSNIKTNSNTNNSSAYNTNLPKTGVESSVPVAMFVVILGISAIYAYRKINEYRNI